MRDRVLTLEGVHNFRDYGGYITRDGAKLKVGRLFRSGQHVDATPEDLEIISQLNIATIIDLRGNSERVQFPCVRPLNFAAQVLFAEGETAGAAHAPHVEAARDVTNASEAHAAMVRLYASMPFRPRLIEVFQLYFSALAVSKSATLLHCLAGKDRTGLAAGLLHRLLGVHQDDAMADYLLTNKAGNLERRIAAGAETVRANFGHAMGDDAVRTLMSVHPEYLDTAFATIEREHGSIEAYARDVLAVTDDKLEAIASQLLA
ncbi:tyrosine-protein phosphatase [Aquisediminimonas profunda]|uniref:tyrosine-protein phosphatase n=1 Tax=Aquisediminimonas profunda TaxID=1550733 RepID=UPI001C62C508|nr:tyrosine-protein phosphatase [Aquisediminimonas profunda]